MFRLSHYMKQLVAPTPVRRRAGATGDVRPVVIWNLTRRCNLKCRHCYSVSSDHDFPGELTSDEAIAVLDDLAFNGRARQERHADLRNAFAIAEQQHFAELHLRAGVALKALDLHDLARGDLVLLAARLDHRIHRKTASNAGAPFRALP